MVMKIMGSHTLRGLARQMNGMLKSYLSFDIINVMFKDPEKETLYSITFGDEEEQRLQIEQLLAQSETESERQAVLDKASMQDFILPASNMILYPLHAGLTSKVYNTQETVVINNFVATSHLDFVNEIDNPKSIKKIDNLMIGALIREDGSTNGVVQLFNQRKNISAYDRRRFRALSKFFGGCIEKIEDGTRKMTTVVAAKMNYGLATKYVKDCHEAITLRGTLEAFANLKKPFDQMELEIKKDQEELYGKDGGKPPTPQQVGTN